MNSHVSIQLGENMWRPGYHRPGFDTSGHIWTLEWFRNIVKETCKIKSAIWWVSSILHHFSPSNLELHCFPEFDKHDEWNELNREISAEKHPSLRVKPMVSGFNVLQPKDCWHRQKHLSSWAYPCIAPEKKELRDYQDYAAPLEVAWLRRKVSNIILYHSISHAPNKIGVPQNWATPKKNKTRTFQMRKRTNLGFWGPPFRHRRVVIHPF